MHELVDIGKTPEQWSELLCSRGIHLTPRTLRAKAREYGQYYSMGRVMILTPDHLETMLKAEASREKR